MRIIAKQIHAIPIKDTGGVKVTHKAKWTLLGLETDTGLIGWGEGSDSHDDDQCVLLIDELAGSLLNQEIDPLTVAENLAQSAPPERLPRTVRSAIAQALIDLAVKEQSQSAAAYLSNGGDIPETVPVYANINRKVKIRTPEVTAAAGLETLNTSITRIKFAPFDEVSPEALEKEGEKVTEPGIARLEALREAIGSGPELMLDLHWRFTPETVPLLAAIAKTFDVSWLEDPLPVFNPTDTRKLSGLSGARITGGEALFTFDELEALASSGAIDLLIADVKYVGGTIELDRICKMAASHGVAFAPHNPSGPVSTAASAHVVAANSNAEVLEYSFGEVPWRFDLAEGEVLKDGHVRVAGPGYGLTIHPDKVGDPA